MDAFDELEQWMAELPKVTNVALDWVILIVCMPAAIAIDIGFAVHHRLKRRN